VNDEESEKEQISSGARTAPKEPSFRKGLGRNGTGLQEGRGGKGLGGSNLQRSEQVGRVRLVGIKQREEC
jgi:hypothetical protein